MAALEARVGGADVNSSGKRDRHPSAVCASRPRRNQWQPNHRVCIAQGASNAEIMRRLFISEGTVKGHVSNILSKLHLADRTQAAVLAWREGFMAE